MTLTRLFDNEIGCWEQRLAAPIGYISGSQTGTPSPLVQSAEGGVLLQTKYRVITPMLIHWIWRW